MKLNNNKLLIISYCPAKTNNQKTRQDKTKQKKKKNKTKKK